MNSCTYWQCASNDYALICLRFSKSTPPGSSNPLSTVFAWFLDLVSWFSAEGWFLWYNAPLSLVLSECYIYQGQWVLAVRQETQSVDRATTSQSCQYNSCSLLTVIWLFSKPLIWNTIGPLRRSSWGSGTAGNFPSIFYFLFFFLPLGDHAPDISTLKWFTMPGLPCKEWSP